MRFIALFLILLAPQAAVADENLVVDGDFEQGLAGWNEAWSRTPGIRATLDRQRVRGGSQSVRIEHTGSRDWSFQQARPLDVAPGEIYELTGWVRVEGEGDAVLCVTLYAPDKDVISWSFGGRRTPSTAEWRRLRSRFVVPPRGAAITPRLIGNGPTTVWFDDVSLKRSGVLEAMRSNDLPETLTAENPHLKVTLHTADGRLDVADRRAGRAWTQAAGRGPFVLDARPAEGGFDLRLLEPAGALEIKATIRLDPRRPDLLVELVGEGEMPDRLRYPAPFLTEHKVIYASLVPTDCHPDRPYVVAGGDITPRVTCSTRW